MLQKTLGVGQFGEVWLGKDKRTQKLYAIKIVDKRRIEENELLSRLFETEVSIMHEIHHRNILHLYDFYESEHNFYLVLDYCKDKDFVHYQKSLGKQFFTERETVSFLRQIANGFFELRRNKIIHRDFKLANIMVDGERLVIGDFGFARKGYEMTNTRLGTPITMAPELLDDRNHRSYDSKIDIWSVGVVLYQLLFGQKPFTGKSRAQLLQCIKRKVGFNRLELPR